MRVLALDVGNTSVAAACFGAELAADPGRAPTWCAHARRGGDEAREVAAWIERALPLACDAIVVGSVHRFGEALAAGLRAAGAARVVGVHRGDAFPIESDAGDALAIGVDRLAAAFAAHALARGAARVVSAGTAVTVDAVDARGAFRGGAIVPGRRLLARSLHAFTDRLPDVGPGWVDAADGAGGKARLPGRSTQEAIRAGLEVSFAAGVAALVAGLAGVAPDSPVFATGGDAPWLLERLLFAACAEPFLAARGLALACASGRLGAAAR